MAIHAEYTVSAEKIAELSHDLRAPISNARGFKSELIEAVGKLSSVINSLGPELSDQHRNQLNDIISDDIVVCADMIVSSVDKLQEKVKEFEQTFPTSRF